MKVKFEQKDEDKIVMTFSHWLQICMDRVEVLMIRDACNKFLEQYKQEDKPKKLKLRITQKKAKRLQEILCRGCTDTTACGMCIACLNRYIKKEV